MSSFVLVYLFSMNLHFLRVSGQNQMLAFMVFNRQKKIVCFSNICVNIVCRIIDKTCIDLFRLARYTYIETWTGFSEDIKMYGMNLDYDYWLIEERRRFDHTCTDLLRLERYSKIFFIETILISIIEFWNDDQWL